MNLHITTKHTGKMNGMQSLSTSCQVNEYCKQRAQVEGSICQKCYASRMTRMYKNLDAALQRNAEILTSRVLDESELPEINCCYFRFEAFGDLINTTQVVNYFNICKKNPDVHFALWTKNPWIVREVADQKPSNLTIIFSSPTLNRQADISKMPYIDKVFTVYDKPTIERDGIDINCGARSCLKCHKCYTDSETVTINEQLK